MVKTTSLHNDTCETIAREIIKNLADTKGILIQYDDAVSMAEDVVAKLRNEGFMVTRPIFYYGA